MIVPLIAAVSLMWALAAGILGAGLGRMLTLVIGGLLSAGIFANAVAFNRPERGSKNAGSQSRRLHFWIEMAVIITAVVLWWWEVARLGQLPLRCEEHGLEAGTLLARCVAHLVLFMLLAAASWIDLRYRVIPDCVTVTGVLLGLATLWLWPDVLLPVAGEVPRSFAPPQLQLDVLGFFGGLHTAPGIAWLGPWPCVPGLLLPLAIFTIWWLVCTSPFLDLEPSRLLRWLEPRGVILVLGLLAIVAAWVCGGDRYVGLQSSLIGLAVSGGIVGAIRTGASRAMGREAMGLGDVTLMAMVGAWLGWQACVVAFFLAAFLGVAHGAAHLLFHRENELPFGPSLCLASAGVVVAWRPIWEIVGLYFNQPLDLAIVVGSVVILTAVTLFVWEKWRNAPAAKQ